MMAAPRPVKSMRTTETYEIEVGDDGRILTFDAAAVDKNNGVAKYAGLTFQIEWRPERRAD